MTFWKINKVTVTLTAAFVVLVGGFYISSSDCGSGCLLSSVFATSEAVAGPGCSAKSEGASAKSCGAKSAKADGTTPEFNATAVNATEGATCEKEACIAKCMAEKGYTRAEAEACYAKCQSSKADGKSCHGSEGAIKTAAADGQYSREAYIDALVAKGMSKEEAAKAAEDKGLTSFASDKAGCSSAGKASAKGAGCCASKAKATTTTASAKASESSN